MKTNGVYEAPATMELVAGNETLELWLGERGGQRTLMHHVMAVMDPRANLVVELVKAWGGAQLVSGALVEVGDQPHKRASRPTIEHLVVMATDTVDLLYEELTRRGWILKAPPFGGERP